MRTTLAIDDDVLAAAREIAETRRESLGAVVSQLARRSLQPVTWSIVDGLPKVDVPAGTPIITSEDVARALDDE